jgi:hypothetical protein
MADVDDFFVFASIPEWVVVERYATIVFFNETSLLFWLEENGFLMATNFIPTCEWNDGERGVMMCSEDGDDAWDVEGIEQIAVRKYLYMFEHLCVCVCERLILSLVNFASTSTGPGQIQGTIPTEIGLLTNFVEID